MLRYKSCNFNNPQEKPRMYFCCHPDEFDPYFDIISDGVLSAYDCIMYYPADPLALSDDWQTDISRMQLIIVPVTLRFLDHDNSAAHQVCTFAVSNHIPILPIVVEDSACDGFSRRWGSFGSLNIQDVLPHGGNNQELLKITLSGYFTTKETEGSWIFLSHSSDDISKVRLIRNQFEKNGHNPLAFHLKCLKADTSEGREELLGLIKREIDARDWFIFCESDSAHRSEYVNIEKRYVIDTGKKKIWSLDLSLPVEDLLAAVDRISRNVRVYLSYRKKDRGFAQILQQALAEKDFDVWYDDFLTPGEGFSDTIAKKIQECNYFIALISNDYEPSYCSMYELPYAIECNKRVIPIVIGKAAIPMSLLSHQCYRLPSLPQVEDMRLFAELIEAELRSQMQSPVSQTDALDTISRFYKRFT